MKTVFFLLLINFSAVFSHEFPMLNNRIAKTDKRYSTFQTALTLMTNQNAYTIVETGTARGGSLNCAGDGCSTLIFGDWAYENHATVYSVDIDPLALSCSFNALGKAADNVLLVEQDSIEFLSTFNGSIDFLYLDSYGFQLDNPLPSQNHHLNEIIAAYPHLARDCVVMIDDCDLPYGGKGKLVIEYLLERGWKILAESYQVILIRGDQ
ncbi:MAG: class I SAM-dependent methyltransferase [Simkaniaceae bacterium]|nr:class I SAM-dependent methyltransferase [Candidatus Sacchlamyda saccharinae]